MPPKTRRLQPPPGRRGFKVSESRQALPLVYLGWGPRRFGENPISIAPTLGYSYSVVLEGSPTLLTDTARLKTEPGTALIIDIDCSIGWTDTPNSHSKVAVWIWRNAPHIEELRPSQNAHLAFKIAPKRLPALERLHKESRKELSRLDTYSPYALAAQQKALDVEILRSRSGFGNKPAGESRYAAALDWMRQNLSAPTPVSELSVYLNVSESTLQRIFRRRNSEGPLTVFQSLKAEKAAQLLRDGHSVKAVAYRLGYRHPNDFTRFYTKHFGHAPSHSSSE